MTFDIYVLQSLYAMREIHISLVMISITMLGESLVIAGFASVATLTLYLHKRSIYIAGLLLAVAGSATTTLLLKELIHRARPDTLYAVIGETGYSFPSAHAALAFAFYGYIGFVALREIHDWRLRHAVNALCIIITGAVGFSRLYLGVHYASDVLAGFAVGAVFLWLGKLLTKKLEKRLS